MTTRTRNIALVLLLFVIIAAGVGLASSLLRDRGGGGGSSNGGEVVDRPEIVVVEDGGGEMAVSAGGLEQGGASQSRLQIALSAGQQQVESVQPLPVAQGTPLSPEAIEAILARLPEATAVVSDVVDFRLPEESLPPPRTGETISESFPPPEGAPPPEEIPSGPLEVLRYAPEGEISLAPFLNVTFNQPMVPLNTVEALSQEEVPVDLTPPLPGVWNWLGSKTLRFEYRGEDLDRFPMATEYVAEIPAGTESTTGGVLAETVRWSFSTPPAQMVRYYPNGGPQRLDPLFFIAFDQMIDPAAVLETIRVTAGGQSFALRLATAAEVEADETVARLAEEAHEERWLAFRTQQSLPAASMVDVTVGPGTPSAEGPLLTEEAQSFTFETYAPLRIDDHSCGWYDGECPPLVPLRIIFNNPLDEAAFTEEMIAIEPPIERARVLVADNSVSIEGLTQGRTNYDVTLRSEIGDIFGQTLGEDETVTFRVGSAPKLLTGPDRRLVTLDPSASAPTFSVYTINYDSLRLRLYAVEPSDWRAYQEYLDKFYQEEGQLTPPGREVLDETINIEAEDDVLTETAIDLSESLQGESGHLLLVVQPPRPLLSRNRDWLYQTVQAWVQVTDIGLDAFADYDDLLVWATNLDDGAPLSGVTVSLEPNGVRGQTGAEGTARLQLPESGGSLLVARQGEETAILPGNSYYWDESFWKRRPPNDELRWFVFDDRQMYRPGEEVHVKGWLRRIGWTEEGDVSLLGDALRQVSYRVVGPQGNDLLQGQAEVNALGGFDLAFNLPSNANLGYASLHLMAEGQLSGLSGTDTYHEFQIQEFRRPEFEVEAGNETRGPYFDGGSATVFVSANYYAGGALPNAEVTWNVTSSPSTYAPPNWPDFIFGRWTPWWWYGYAVAEEPFFPGPGGQGGLYETFSGRTDAAGNHYLQLDFDIEEVAATVEDLPPLAQPFSVRAEATVMDVNRQAWAANTNLLVHPADLYVGLRSERTFVERREPLDIETIVTDLDGEPVAGRPVEVQAARLEWQRSGGSWQEVEADVQTCSVESALEPVVCSFSTEEGGRYRITATVTDEQGRRNQSQFERWVSGGQRRPARDVEQEEVTLIPDKESYQPGDVAQILVQAPFSPAEGLLTVARSGILYTERFRMEEGSYTLEVPIAEGHIPNLQLQVDLVGSAPRSSDSGEPLPDVPPRPAYATGRLNLSIPPLSRTLEVAVAPRQQELEPGGQTTLDLTVSDAAGRPLSGAEIAVVVVDEAILALTGYQMADPLAAFYPERPSAVESSYGRASIVLVNPLALQQDVLEQVEVERVVVEGEEVMEEAAMEAPMAAEAMADSAAFGAAPAEQEQAAPIRLRSDFNPLATFAPAVRTDSDGRAEVEVTLPDNLTRYRVMVVAVDAGGRQFGSSDSTITARLPLMVRPSAPRFLNFGDEFELPLVLQNQTDNEMTVEVALRASNLELTEGAGQRVTVPANDRVEVRFPATTASPGTARVQIAAVSGDYADAASVEMPVYTPATTEAFATYGVVDESDAIAQPVAAPEDVFSQFGGLEISTSSTALQALTDAVLYLVEHRYESSEELASRILAVAALRDVLTAFEAEGLPSPQEMEAAVQRDIERLQGMQNGDGGFPIWERYRESIPFYSIHVAHALVRAQLKGFDVPQETLQRSLDYLRNVENHYPPWYSQRLRHSLSAYALYVRDLAGDSDPQKAVRLLREGGLDEGEESLSLEAVAWIWQLLYHESEYQSQAQEIARYINNRAVETARAANFTTSYGEEAYLMLHSNRRSDAVILDALIAAQPESDLIPKVVNGLLAHKTRGRWSNTQENVFILLALDRYFNTFEAQTPEFVARFWLGDTYAGEHEYVGRTTERHETVIPMSFLTEIAPGEEEDLIIGKEGVGRLYYRLGLRYAPTNLELEPLDRGFIVERVYEAVDDPGDVRQDEAGIWYIKAGARVRVRLTMVADNRRYHVALVDPLPAGLEIVNPALAVSGDIPGDPTDPGRPYGWWWWWGPWYEHQNMRDQRAEAFTTLLWDGVYDYDYIARATTPGTFVVPPAKAEEMYSPEVFGRSASDLVIVE